MTRPTSSAATTLADGHLAGVEVDVDFGHGRRPAEGRVGIAAIGRVVEVDARVRLELLVDPESRRGSGRRRGRSRRTSRRSRCLDHRPQPAARLDHAGRRRPSRCARRPSARCRARARCPDGASSTVVDRHAEGLGDELREDRLGPLAHLGRGRPGSAIRPSAVSSTDATEARWTSPDPGEPGAVPGQCQADPAGPAGRARSARRSGTSRRRPDARGPWYARPDPLELAPPRPPARGPPRPATLLAQDLAGRRRVARPRRRQRRRSSSGRLAQRLGDPVDLHLGGELGLGRAESAEGAVRRRVRGHRAGADPDVRAAIRAAGVERAPRQDDRASACSRRRRPSRSRCPGR